VVLDVSDHEVEVVSGGRGRCASGSALGPRKC
jgi:hypothetical protein